MTSSPASASGGEVILSCLTKCTLNNKHTYIWYKNGGQATDGFTKVNKLYLDSVSKEDLQQYSCAVRGNTSLMIHVLECEVFAAFGFSDSHDSLLCVVKIQ